MGLNVRQQLFVDSYLVSFNATQAALAAGYSEKTAYSHGARLLKNVEISETISQRLNEKAMSADEVLMRLAEQARGGYGQYLTANGVDMSRLIADGKQHLVKGMKPGQFGMTIEFHDAQAALVHIGRHHGLFKDVSETKAQIEISDATEARERLAGRIAGIAQRNAAGGNTEGPDPR